MELDRPLAQRPSRRICPYCRDDLEFGDPESVECEGCATGYHAECLAELERCAILGCLRAVERPRRPRPRERARAGLPEVVVGHHHRCAACARDVVAAVSVSCPSCFAPYHMGCAEDRGSCTAAGCKAALPVVRAEWPGQVLLISGVWGGLMSLPMITIFPATTSLLFKAGYTAVAYGPLVLAFGFWLATRRLRQDSVRHFGELVGVVATTGLFVVASAAMAVYGVTPGSKVMAALFAVFAVIVGALGAPHVLGRDGRR